MNRLLLPLLFYLALLPNDAFACRCQQPSLEKSFHNADIVYIARILKKDAPKEQSKAFTARLIGKPFKGEIDDTIVLTTAHSSAACGIDFKSNETYLLFGRTNSSGEPPYLYNFCDGTREFDPKSPKAHSNFPDAPAQSITRVLTNLSITDLVQRKGIGGVPRESSIRGILKPAENLKSSSLKVHLKPKKSAPTLPELSSLSHLQQREYTYERSGPLVYDIKEKWVKVLGKNQKSGWILNDKNSYEFISLSDLLISRSTYLTEHWNKLIWPEPGAGIPTKLDVTKEQAIQIERSQKIANSLWLYIKVYSEDPCSGGDPQKFKASGWIPAWNENGELTSWFWSRGC